MSEHYTDGRRWSYISQAWIFADGWNDREEIARLEAKVRELEERLDRVEQERDQRPKMKPDATDNLTNCQHARVYDPDGDVCCYDCGAVLSQLPHEAEFMLSPRDKRMLGVPYEGTDE